MKIPECLTKISPLWSDRLIKAKNLRELSSQDRSHGVLLDIEQPSSCIVGEAHMFNPFYDSGLDERGSCRECGEISMQFAKAIKPWVDYGVKKPKKFNALVEEFCKHMQNVHGVGV